MSKTQHCKNPECVKGRTPGIVQLSVGNTKAPLISNGHMAKPKMRWGWVNCPACNPDEHMKKHNIGFKLVSRTPDEIAARKQWATDRAEYKPQTVTSRLSGLNVPAPAQPSSNSELLELTRQLAKLTAQVSELLEENRQLRKQLEGRAVTNEISLPVKPS